MTGPLIDILGGEVDIIMVEEEGEVAGKFEGSSPPTNTTGIEPLSFATWATRLRVGIATVKAVVLGVTSVNYHPKECCMLTSSVDGTVCVWKP
ncbi:hypothetical protein GW17_00013864 [Ensete ventricosum]|uniref:Uncharacterized protein n=1 Tax=Ensete ventricosum TaxID=4639 RepID=A0A426XGE2_ENSVE|nr:hypothetical protein B296_00029402 [Ensete ventricosum]RWW21962.1 hypothetical protein GW17_00013864 [Ensete ventricosum]